MPYVTPVTRSTGFLVTAAVWNADIVDNVIALAKPPTAHVYRNAAQSIATATPVALVANVETLDSTGNMWGSAAGSRITVPYAGLYLATANVNFATGATGIRNVYFRLNGATTVSGGALINNAGGGTSTTISISRHILLAANDYIEVMAQHTQGANLNVLLDEFTMTLAYYS